VYRAFAAGRPELESIATTCGTVVFPRIHAVADANTFVSRLLSERETAVVPGHFFEAPAHFRLGVGGATEPLRHGLAAIGDALTAHAF
jgi:aspartate/methionine/tyrosine aminotransferase